MSSRQRRKSGKPATAFNDPPPAGAAKYKKAIAHAKAKAKDKSPKLEGTPSFDNLPSAPEKGPGDEVDQVSKKTAAGLQAVAEATQAARDEEEELGEYYIEEEEEEEPEELSKEEKLRKVIEARLEPLDIGAYFMGGELSQVVIIIPGKFTVRFRSVTDEEEVFVDQQLVDEGELSARQFLRRSNEWGMATHIHTLNGVKWPGIFKGDDNINDDAMAMRMRKVRKIHGPIFSLLLQNLQWFLERISDSLNAEALGNG